MPVIVVDGDKDGADTLSEMLRHTGLHVVAVDMFDIQCGSVDWVDLIERRKPSVIVWDVPYPYAQAVAFLRLVCTSTVVRETPFVIMSTNAPAVRLLLQNNSPRHVAAILQKPYAMYAILGAIADARRWFDTPSVVAALGA